MKNLIKVLFVFLFVLTLHFSLYALSFADIPHLINYQGKLADKDNKIVSDGVYSITFRIYDAESAGNLLWEETQSVSASKGIFSVMLGGVTVLNLAFDKPYWLEIKVGSEVMSPRQRMASVGYAIRAENSDKINGIQVSTLPEANKLLALDSNSKIPMNVLALKVYDSGWFPVSTAQTYSKAHNLGTTKVLWRLYFSTDVNGSNMEEVDARADESHNPTWHHGGRICNISTTICNVKTCRDILMDSYGTRSDGIFNSYTSGYYRVIGIALE